MTDLTPSKPRFTDSANSIQTQHTGEFVYLQPGEIWTGQGHVVLKTLLGSCVTITLWHIPTRRAAMCHYLLPFSSTASKKGPAGYHADQVFRAFEQWRLAEQLALNDIQAKIFGGGNMFARQNYQKSHFDVSKRNTEAGLAMLQKYGYPLVAQDIGGERYRTLIFDAFSGDVWVRYGPQSAFAKG